MITRVYDETIITFMLLSKKSLNITLKIDANNPADITRHERKKNQINPGMHEFKF